MNRLACFASFTLLVWSEKTTPNLQFAVKPKTHQPRELVEGARPGESHERERKGIACINLQTEKEYRQDTKVRAQKNILCINRGRWSCIKTSIKSRIAYALSNKYDRYGINMIISK